MNIIATVRGATEAFATKIGAFIPNLLAALIILVLGWAVCNIVKKLGVRILRLAQFDTLAERAGIDAMLKRGGIRQGACEILGVFIFWFLFLIVVLVVIDVLDLPGVGDALNAILLYLPKILAALVLLILGLYFANFVEMVTRTSCANAGLQQAEGIGRVAYFATVIFIVAALLDLLGIATEIVLWAFILVFGAICLALAIAFGLGGREVAARYLEKWLEQGRKEK